MSYTLGQAAKATGVSKPTISEAIKKGKISAVRKENGSFEIDPAELHRVYPPLASSASKDEPEAEHFRTHNLTAKIMVLEAQIKAIGELKDQIAAERDDLRAERDRLLGVIEEQAGSVKQLTYQPKPEAEAPQAANQNPPPLPAHVNWWLVLAVTAVVTVIVSGLVAVVARTTGGHLF
jgi:excisionase family DNA binding protein